MTDKKITPADATAMIDEGVKIALGTLFVNWLAQAQGGAKPVEASEHMQNALQRLFWLRDQAVAAVSREGFLL